MNEAAQQNWWARAHLARIVMAALVVVVLAVGCRADVATPSAVEDANIATDAATEPTLEDALERLRTATIRVTAQGVDAGGAELIEVTASGFLIDADGFAVTNMHVISGAQQISVSLPDRPDPVTAEIVGIAECNDLALLKLDGGGYPFLEFRSGEVRPGLPVWAAGYPLTAAASADNRDYTLTNGIVNTVTGSGETHTASVQGVIEHSAKGRTGDSGGPVVDDQARVVGVTYFGADSDDVNLAIDGALAERVAQQLRAGSFESIGAEVRAVVESSDGGVQVVTVHPGSEAELLGLVPRDRILSLGDQPVGADQKLTDYCEIVRARPADEPLGVEVIRPASGARLVGDLGGAPLAVVEGDLSSGGPIEFTIVRDETGQLSVSVPVEWTEVDGARNPDFGPSVYASSDQPAFVDGLSTGSLRAPGLIVELGPPAGDRDLVTLADEWISSDFEGICQSSLVRDWSKEDGSLSGTQMIFGDCGELGSTIVILMAVPANGSFLFRFAGVSVDEPSAQALETALQTFRISPR